MVLLFPSSFVTTFTNPTNMHLFPRWQSLGRAFAMSFQFFVHTPSTLAKLWLSLLDDLPSPSSHTPSVLVKPWLSLHDDTLRLLHICFLFRIGQALVEPSR